MRPTLFRLSVLVVSIALGVSVSIFLSKHDVSDQAIPQLTTTPTIERLSYSVESVVISVPSEDEFYIGKRRFELAQIHEVVERKLISIPNGKRVVYLKPAVGIKAETLAAVIKEVRLAGVERIKLVVDEKKVAR